VARGIDGIRKLEIKTDSLFYHRIANGTNNTNGHMIIREILTFSGNELAAGDD
jgi:hypothetical protein